MGTSAASLEEREARLVREVLAGNVPGFLRTFVPVEVTATLDGRTRSIVLRVLPDYLSVGDDVDFVRTPLSPRAAQRIADRTGTMLPTPTIVDAIWAAASEKLSPRPIPPSPAMTTAPVFLRHHYQVEAGRRAGSPNGRLIAGTKKDVVLTPRLAEEVGRVAIYGWHQLDGRPIQPLYVGHTERWVDYSHGVRLVSRRVQVDGVEYDLVDLLEDEDFAFLFSAAGVIRPARYPSDRR